MYEVIFLTLYFILKHHYISLSKYILQYEEAIPMITLYNQTFLYIGQYTELRCYLVAPKYICSSGRRQSLNSKHQGCIFVLHVCMNLGFCQYISHSNFATSTENASYKCRKVCILVWKRILVLRNHTQLWLWRIQPPVIGQYLEMPCPIYLKKK